MHKKENKNNQRHETMQKNHYLIIAQQKIHFKAFIHALNLVLTRQKFNNYSISKGQSNRLYGKAKKHTLSGPSKTVLHSIKQPALKLANKISAAKKCMMDAQRIKGK